MSAEITTVSARAKLEPCGNPYYRRVMPGLNVGYRKNERRAGAWVARRWLDGKAVAKTLELPDPDGDDAFYAAVREAKKWLANASLVVPVSISVRQAIEAYRAIRAAAPRAHATDNFGSLMRAHVLGHAIADLELNRLTRADLKAWRASLQRTDKSGPLSVSSVRRICKDLSAALNYAGREHELTLTTQTIAQGLRGEKNEVQINSRTPQVLLEHEVKAIVAAAREIDADLYRLVLVLAATGARFSQVQRLTVGDVDIKRSRINVPVSHKGGGKKEISHCPMPVSDEVIAALLPVINGRQGGDILLTRRGQPWQTARELSNGHWSAILAKAGLRDDLIPYCLRHSSIVAWLIGRFPSRYVAQLHDTSSAMIEAHYARYVTDAFDDQASAWVKGRTYGGAEIVPLKAA
jgi:integrase